MAPKKQQSKAERFAKSSKGAAVVDIGFISFAEVANNGENMAVLGPSPIYTGTNPDLLVISKRLTKKNSSTRIKALHDLKIIIENIVDIISPEFIAFFTFIYERLILDNDRFVRQDTNGVLAFLLQRNRKQFKSYIVSLLGPLLLTICDPVKEVSQSAEQAFESAFPNPEKRKEIISIHLSQLFRYLKKTISTTAEDLSDMSSTSVEEADERYERVISSALLSFAKVIPFISEENIQQSVIEGFIDSRVFPMGASPRLSFRKASFQVFISICEGNPNLIASSNLRDQLFSILTSSVTSERASDVMPILLQSLVCFMKAFPTSWEKIDLSNFLFPQLKHLAETYFNLCFPALLPLISTIPHERILADSSAVLGFLQHVRTLSGSVHDQLTPLLTFAEISTFLIVKIMKLNDNLDTPTSLLYTSLSADLVSVFVELLKLGNSRPMVSLLSHLHKQSLNHHDNAFQTWDLDLSMALEQALVNAAGQGLRGDFLNYLDQIAFYYFSIAHIDYSKNTCVIQKDLGSFSSLSSLFRFARTQCGVLSGCTHKNQSEEVFLLWASVFLKMGSILLDIIHSNSELISLTLYDVHSDIQSKEVFLVLDSLFNQSRMSSGLESQCKYALKVFHELSCFIHKLSFQNSSIINDDISTLLEVVHERQSILGYVLLLKDGLITSWEQFSSFGPQVSSRSWIINCLGSTNTSVSFSTLEVALAVECQKKGLLSDCDFNSSLRVWLDLTDYFTNGNFSVPPNERIISHFTSAFILHNPSQDSQLIQEEFGLINCWESIRRLFPICDSVAPAFAWAIISQLKSILFSLIGAQLPPQEVSQKHFLYLLRDFFELVSCGYFKCLEMQEICVGLGLFDLSLWDHFYQNALSMLDTGLNNSVVDLAIAITSGFLGMRAVCLEPYLCFRILLTLGLMQHAFPAQEVGSDSINNTATSLYMLSLRNISPSCLSDLIAKTFPILRCCRHPLEVNSLLMTISNILTGESTSGSRPNTDFIEISEINKGIKGYYLSKLFTDSESVFTITAIELTLLDLDDRVGEAFYTMGYPDGREIQTERLRILFPKYLPSVINNCSDIVHSRDFVDCIFSDLFMEVVKVVRRLIDLIEGNTIPTEEITSEFKFVILILRNLSAFDIISHRNHKIFVGFIRHAVIRLLSCHPVGAAHLVHVGLDLFGALIESDIGLGSGLWIHVLIYPLISQIIQSLKSTKLVLGASERAPYLIKILSVVNLLLKKIPSALAINYASAVISLALLDISPNDSELSTILITTGWMVWSCKALESSFSNVHYDWESIVFRRCVDKILVSDVNPSLYALDQALASCNSASHLIGSDFLTMSDEVEAWRYLSQSRHPIETRLILYRVLAAWSTLEVRLNLDSDESLDEELASNILLERVLNPYLRLFESNLLLWADHLKLVSLDSLSWCICGHVGRLFCPSLETGEHIDFFGIMLQWLLLLHKIESYCISAPWSHRSLIGTAISKSKFFHCLMKISVGLLMTIQIREFPSSKELSQLFCHGDLLEKDPSDKYRICFLFYVFSRTIMTLPTASRAFYLGECSRSEANIIEKFVESYINERVIQREVSIIEAIQSETLDIRCCPSTGEIITTYVADEVSIEMSIKLPKLYPLRNVEVECQRRMGINEGRWRKWTLQIIQLLSQRDGSVYDAILFWKKNVDKEFEGVEPCPICYSVLDPKSLALPTLQCPTCKNKFHPPCLYKWFNTSGKSKCVLCQQPFFH